MGAELDLPGSIDRVDTKPQQTEAQQTPHVQQMQGGGGGDDYGVNKFVHDGHGGGDSNGPCILRKFKITRHERMPRYLRLIGLTI